ncbi:Putative protein of unknown function [Podospora comata]|uniref:G domain-containing protein n=1 Tax=Podospora comata TaxID=48703 RepID=A0ABY6S5S8_PODCO|nr:Putative protein of unknown function [Podospora comata]
MWFCVNKSSDESFLDYSNRLIDIMLESDGFSTSDRYPQLISFVGKTGEGKSTVIKMLIGREKAKIGGTKSFPAPVNGLTDDLISTSGDVHLYADPATHHEKHPVLLADCEGLGGGQNVPRAKEHQSMYAVKCLFPRILYTFSDVIVFVVQEPRTFQSDVLVNLVEWAYSSIENAVNQLVLPHLIITLNRTDNAINEE